MLEARAQGMKEMEPRGSCPLKDVCRGLKHGLDDYAAGARCLGENDKGLKWVASLVGVLYGLAFAVSEKVVQFAVQITVFVGSGPVRQSLDHHHVAQCPWCSRRPTGSVE